MEFEDRPKRRLTEELASLRQQISELKDVAWEGPEETGTPEPSRHEPVPFQSDESRLLGQIIDRSPDGVFAFNRDLIITYWNEEMEQLCDRKSESVLGRKAADVFSNMSKIGENRYLLRALNGETFAVSDIPYSIAHLEQEGFFEGKYGALRDASGLIQGGYGIIRDITDRRQVEETLRAVEARYRELFDHANDIVYTHDLEGNLTSLNKAAERITGFSRSEALQMNLIQFVAPDYQQTARKMIDRQISSKSAPTSSTATATPSASKASLATSRKEKKPKKPSSRPSKTSKPGSMNSNNVPVK
jgi:PAS domain S-box-containing protein